MELLTIGAFARASRLSPKALRRYDELGLLRPASVDPTSGYRFYAPEQLPVARLVAWLRRLGMPLARIQVVCQLGPRAAAQAVGTYWAEVEAEVNGRRELALFLMAELSQPVHERSTPRLSITYATGTDAGLVRPRNQDAAYADPRLLAVADGFGPAGAPAGATAIDVLKNRADPGGSADHTAGDLLNALQDAVLEANQAIGTLAESSGDGPGSTLTAMVWTGTQLALVHIGDSRAYLLRAGRLFQITHDHSLVQSMVDDDRLTPEEALSHPQRALLLRALDGRPESAADLHLQDAELGDRYLLCSKGLTAVLTPAQLEQVLTAAVDPQHAVDQLLALVAEAGAPDNVSCVAADVVPAVTRDSGAVLPSL
jgi:protein phosphatase